MDLFDFDVKFSTGVEGDISAGKKVDAMQSFGNGSITSDNNSGDDNKPVVNINSDLVVTHVSSVDVDSIDVDPEITDADYTETTDTSERSKSSINNAAVFSGTTDDISGMGNSIFADLKKYTQAFIHKSVKASAILLSKYQVNRLYNNFEKGKLIQSGDFSYLLYKGQLMAFKYSGKSMDIVIPDKVGNVAVTAVYRGLLHKTVFNNHKVRGIKRYFSDDVEELSVESILECYRGVRSIQLPKYLKSVPDLFGGCQRLKSVVIPASVKIISPDLIKHSRISELYFDGEVPQNLKFLRKKNCTIYCRQEYKAWYNQALRGR